MKLSPQQHSACHAPLDRPVVVLAGPGSGKTTVLTHRLQWMIDKVKIPARNIVAVTFANKMANEMLDRAMDMGVVIPRENVCTIHAFCYRLLKAFGDKRELAKDWKIKATIQDHVQSTGWDVPARLIRWWIDRSKLEGVKQEEKELFGFYYGQLIKRMPMDDTSSLKAQRLAWLTVAVNEMLAENKMLTYADMVNDAWWLLHDPEIVKQMRKRVTHILVDEGQDTFPLAVRILRVITPRNFFIVGDNDQLLYRYTGASPEKNLFRVAELPDAKLYKLEENRRSRPEIVGVSNRLIDHNYTEETAKFKKTLVATRPTSGEQAIVTARLFTAEAEADWIANHILHQKMNPGDVFVCTRTNAQLALIERSMMRRDIPYIVTGNAGFFRRSHIVTVLAYLRLALNEKDDESFEKVFNVAAKGFTNLRGIPIPHRYLGAAFVNELRRAPSLMAGVRQKTYSNRFANGANDLLAFVDAIQRHIYNHHRSTDQVLRRIIDDCFLSHYMLENGLVSLDPSSDDNVYDDLQVLLTLAKDHPAPKDFLAFVDKMLAFTQDNEKRKKVVELSTVHQLKGKERPVVFAAGWVEGVLPHVRSLNGENQIQTPLPIINDSDVTDERCIAFVAVSRAKEQIIVTTYSQWQGGQEAQPSRFLYEMMGGEFDWNYTVGASVA